MQITITLDPENARDIQQAINLLAAVNPDVVARRAIYAVAATPVTAGAVVHHVEAPPAPFVPPEDNPAVFTAGAAASTTAPEAAQVFTTPASAPPAPVPLAPVAAVPPVPAAPTASALGVDLDAEGLPWDARIHAKSSTGPGGVKNADGTWRSKRGLNDGAFVASIEAELRAAMGAPAATGGVNQVTFGGAGVSPPAPIPMPPVAGASSAALAPPFVGAGVSPPPPVPAVPVAAGPEEITTFPQIMKRISGLRVGQFPAMSQDELTAVLTQAGLPSLPTLASRADLIPAVNAGIDALMLSKQH